MAKAKTQQPLSELQMRLLRATRSQDWRSVNEWAVMLNERGASVGSALRSLWTRGLLDMEREREIVREGKLQRPKRLLVRRYAITEAGRQLLQQRKDNA